LIDFSENPIEDSTHYHQTELPVKLKTSSESAASGLHDVLQDHSKRFNKLQEDLKDLSQVSAETFNIVYEQRQSSNSTEAIEALKQQIVILEKGVIKIYHHLEKDNTGKELKSGQQTLQKAINSLTPAAIKTNQKSSTTNVSYLDWKQIAIIITATAIISSLCSLAIFQTVSNWKTDQPQNPVEKSIKPKNKKNSK
jgi:hypothetical protein